MLTVWTPSVSKKDDPKEYMRQYMAARVSAGTPPECNSICVPVETPSKAEADAETRNAGVDVRVAIILDDASGVETLGNGTEAPADERREVPATARQGGEEGWREGDPGRAGLGRNYYVQQTSA